MSPVPDLSDRRAIREEIVRAVAGVPASGAVLVTVDGPAGIGRTFELNRVADDLRAQDPLVKVLRVGAVRWESSVSYGLLHQLWPDIDVAAGDEPQTVARAVADAASDGDETTVIVVDDAHHGDVESLRAIASAVRHHRDRRLAVICTRRPFPAGTTAVHEVLDRVADIAVSVPRLGEKDIVAIAAARGIVLSPAAATHLTRHSGGRPRPAAALLDELPPEAWKTVHPELPAPGHVAAAVREELAEVTADTRRMIQAVAVLAGAHPLPIVCAMAEIADPWSTLDDAERSGLVVVRGGSTATMVDTPDPMVRAAVVATMSRQAVAQWHSRAADTVTDPADALIHVAASGALPDAVVSDRLHDLALARGASGEWGTAATLYRLAGRSTPDPRRREERLTRAVDALIAAGDVPTASGYVAELESLPETPLRDSVLGYLAILRGRPQEADARLRRAWEMVRTRHEPDVAAMICHREVLHNLARCNGDLLVQWADRAVDLVGAEDPTAVEAQAIRGLGLGSTGRTAEALASYRELWGQAGIGAVGQRVQMGAGWLHLATDNIELARAELEAAAPTDFLGGSTRISLWAHAWLARAHFVTGDWDAALRLVDAGVDLVERSGASLIRPLLQWTATQIHALRGDWDAADTSSRRGAAGARDYEIMRVPAALAQAAVAEAHADYAGVLRALTPLTEAWAVTDVAEPGFWPWPDVYANALVQEGRLSEAESFLVVHEERAAARGNRSAGARLACARGRLLGAHGDVDGARASFDTALAALEPLPLLYDRARVNFAYGQTLRRAGKRREADVIISAAREGYLAIGATTYVRRCDRELKAGGVRADLKNRAHDDLTPQEDAVAGLVATGLSNREVAAELYLSVKTVQFHLTRVYAKMGIRSRTELAATRASDPEGPDQG
ncbi:helix-turn-helix transcriptional regulator [Williamsia maris]|uniref:Regulatory protein, luxR family n=1 Tax=Williamsia maris TaxID=72806 RepID=A0ABT1H9Z2_9NOCA|nr:LuxR family transcriptional regulator [Williamsia maris]MCP2174999.1 regulatory protein, luxR family [Williamsia maris]